MYTSVSTQYSYNQSEELKKVSELHAVWYMTGLSEDVGARVNTRFMIYPAIFEQTNCIDR